MTTTIDLIIEAQRLRDTVSKSFQREEGFRGFWVLGELKVVLEQLAGHLAERGTTRPLRAQEALLALPPVPADKVWWNAEETAGVVLDDGGRVRVVVDRGTRFTAAEVVDLASAMVAFAAMAAFEDC
ncbi:hypothetical protein G4X40_20315 [Rhodococcus sp. D2-41]|uniref:hypothetical protein n=1 Tax=Speluncibacter jeojiensis TaxID=2710754 RepID=UPI00240EC892|nr:hypothetical protein [Rhodococcus sp. D2-41]MDG3012488.1 hypothetical protein [Rhodococcus sp. D2-41]